MLTRVNMNIVLVKFVCNRQDYDAPTPPIVIISQPPLYSCLPVTQLFSIPLCKDNSDSLLLTDKLKS